MNFSSINKNKQRQIRKKVIETEENNEDDEKKKLENENENENGNENGNGNEQTIKSIVAEQAKKKKGTNTFSTKNKIAKKATLNLFSFGEDEENGEQEQDSEQQQQQQQQFNSGIKFNPISVRKNDSIFEDSKTTTINNESLGQYTTEMINSLKKNTSSKPTKSSSNDNNHNDNNDIDNKMDIDHQQFKDDHHDDEDKENTTSSSSSSSFTIPTIEQIKLAKEKRQRVRDGKWQDTTEKSSSSSTSKSLSKDFLPLKVSSNDKDDNDNNESRLIREEDDDDEMEEYNIKPSNTIKFGDPGKSNKRDEVAQAVNIENSKNKNDDQDEDEDEDEEILRWRLEQIKKGGGLKDSQLQSIEFQKRKMEKELLLLGPSSENSLSPYYKSSSHLINSPKLSNNNNNNQQQQQQSFIESICKDLNSILIQLNEVKHNHESEFEKVQEALRDSVIQLSIMESEKHVSHDQYIYYDEIKSYCNNMIDCLSEKIPQIEQLDDKYIELLKDYAYDIRKQFKQTLHDQINDIQDNELSNNNKISFNNNNNNKEEEEDKEEDLDEFGRDRSHYEKSSRKKRLEQYKQLIVSLNNTDGNDDFKLYQISDENFYKNEKEKILNSIKSIMDDVDPDFCDINYIADKFKHWKSKDLKSYQKAQMPFIMPSILAPFIRLQMINWSPLDDIYFDTMNWYNQLFSYGDSGSGGDDDDILIPKLVEKIIIPKVETFITYIWNPLSKSQTTNLKNTIDEILIYINDENHQNNNNNNNNNNNVNQEVKFLFSQILSTLNYSISNGNLLIPYSNRDLTFSIKMYMYSLTMLDSIKIWSSNYQYIQLDSLMNLSDDIIDFQILPFLHKIYSLQHHHNYQQQQQSFNIDNLFYLFELFYQYLLTLPWSNKKYKSSVISLLLKLKNDHENENGGLLNVDNFSKLNNLYIPYFT
ncbi:hypothetical protein ACTFIW_012251 [Dictyostelium discoideum]